MLGLGWLLAALVSMPAASPVAGASVEEPKPSRAVLYRSEKDPEGPWSIHILTIDLHNPDYELHSMLAGGAVSGLTTLSEQVKALRPGLGRAVAAINGDFYKTDPKPYRGDPQGLQILNGELVSGPTEHACFWMDPAGKPNTDVVRSLFRVSWPEGGELPFGLNEERAGDTAVLYTTVMGASTGTKPGGREIVLEPVDREHFLPLTIASKIKARVKEIHEAGDTPIPAGHMVLSLGPQLLVDAPAMKPGDIMGISTATTPELAGCHTALGGGPRLVVDGKLVGGWKSPTQRHPRTALGWNNDHLYLVVVDGRQPGLSVGMSFQELANYFMKLGCAQAVNLDGGGSASMWAFGQVVSHPSEGQERPVANGLVLVKKTRRDDH